MKVYSDLWVENNFLKRLRLIGNFKTFGNPPCPFCSDLVVHNVRRCGKLQVLRSVWRFRFCAKAELMALKRWRVALNDIVSSVTPLMRATIIMTQLKEQSPHQHSSNYWPIPKEPFCQFSSNRFFALFPLLFSAILPLPPLFTSSLQSTNTFYLCEHAL